MLGNSRFLDLTAVNMQKNVFSRFLNLYTYQHNFSSTFQLTSLPTFQLTYSPTRVISNSHTYQLSKLSAGPLLARLLDLPSGPMYPGPSVCLSVRQSVCLSQKFSHFPSLLFLIFCNKLACSKCRKVTQPDFRGKLLHFFYKQFFKKRGFWPFSWERVISFGWNRRNR